MHGKPRGHSSASTAAWSAQSIRCFSSRIYISFAWCSLNSCPANLCHQPCGAFCRKWEPGAANTPWLAEEMANHATAKDRSSLGKLLACAPCSTWQPWEPLGCLGDTRQHLRPCCAAPKEAHFNILISRTAFTTCSCGAKVAPMAPTHWDYCWPKRALGFLEWSKRVNWTALGCSALGWWGGSGGFCVHQVILGLYHF